MEIKKCLTCKKEFEKPVWRKAKYCSCKCKAYVPWNKGKKMPEIAGENHYRYVEDRSKIKQCCQERRSPKYKEWRLKVYKRDNFKCKINNKDCVLKIQAHHILPWRDYPELRYEINNGITLCLAHHPRKRAEEIQSISVFTNMIELQKE